MKILVVGGGGREHAIVWKLAQSEKVSELYCAPGNGGIASIAKCLPVGAMEIDKMVQTAKEMSIDLVVVAPDDPLAAGMVDAMTLAGIRAFGPTKAAAIVEASKVYSKGLMQKYNIPTASYYVFDDMNEALMHVESAECPLVVKADGLALGKGVLICNNKDEAISAVKAIMEDKQFGSAGNSIVIEQFLTGREITVLAFTDGKTVAPMVSSQDHKRAYDGDRGLNTGGMGTISPSPVYSEEVADICMKTIFEPTIDALQKEGRPFKGVIYFGLMLTDKGPYVIEYNARFGDPEAQVILPRLKNDLLDIMESTIDGTLDKIQFEWDERATVCVVMASGGYPESYEKGYPITGINGAEHDADVVVFHAGTKLDEKGHILTNGGRVLGVTAMCETVDSARDKAYEAVKKINFEKAHYRTDIGKI